jgi:hypothetical protein
MPVESRGMASCACEVGASQPAQRKKKRISLPLRLASNQSKVTSVCVCVSRPRGKKDRWRKVAAKFIGKEEP